MIPQYDNNLFGSMYLWGQWKTLQYGQAYVNLTLPLYYCPDNSLPVGLVAYASSFKSWIYDSGVSGAQIIQTVSGGGFNGPLTRDSGMMIDYVNGRILLPASYGTGLALTGTAAVQEVNMYQPNETEESILTQGRFYLNPLYGGSATGPIPPYSYVTPAIFINTLHNENKAFALGGLIDCTTSYSFSIYATTNFQLNALLSIFRDAKYQNIPMLNTVDGPLNQWGDTWNGGFNYLQVIQKWGQPGNLIYVKDVHTSKVSDRVKMNSNYFVGLVDLNVSYIRQAPVTTNLFT